MGLNLAWLFFHYFIPWCLVQAFMVRSVHLDCSFWSGRAACLSLAFILLCWEARCLWVPMLPDCDDIAVFEDMKSVQKSSAAASNPRHSSLRNLSRSRALRRAIRCLRLWAQRQQVSHGRHLLILITTEWIWNTRSRTVLCYVFDNWQGVWLGRIASCISGV